MADHDAGDLTHYLSEIQSEPILSRREEVDLFKRLEAGDPTAREQIVRANLRFVVKVAYEFVNRGLPLADLIQEGVVGLLEVIPKYDWRRGHRFSTYAAYWIRQAIQTALRKQCGLIRLPIRKSRLIGRMNECIHQFSLERGREPTIGELAETLGVAPHEVEHLMRLREGVLSLDGQEREDDLRLLDTIPSRETVSPREMAVRNQMKAKVARLLQYLNERERRVLQLRFGFENGRALSLRRASKIVGLSQEGVRRIEQRALEKLRRPAIRRTVAALL